jgi:CheY-like chemotaxis protein
MLEGASKSIEVLLVEDNAGDVRLTQEALKESLVTVNLTVAKDGREAVETFDGGKSWVESKPGNDSTFHFSLPT